MQNYTILGIETSCDETAAAIYSTKDGILSNTLYSQIELHQEFGGVVPEIASRSHLEKISLIVSKALSNAQLTIDQVDAIAVTTKPGLPGSLLVGLCFAKGISWAKKKKLIGVNHLEGHIFSSCIENKIKFPFLCITASGGHTAVYFVEDYGRFKLLGETLDDAAGEAFDKVSKLLNLGYPGGPQIENFARKQNFQDFFQYPRALANSYDFSFSGLKTAVLYHMKNSNWYSLEKKELTKQITEIDKEKIASSLLVAIADTFKLKLKKTFKDYPNINSVSFVGGVAANKFIRKELEEYCRINKKDFYVPAFEYCTDNAAMIAFVGHYKAQQGLFDNINLDIF